jgi:hypothetical protein
MVPVITTAEFLLNDARAALRRRVSEDSRTELSRAFAGWLLHGTEAHMDAGLDTLVPEASTREGAQQDFQTVAILGFGANAGILGTERIEVLKKGLRRQAGRGVLIDELPAAFCSDAVGVLGVALGTKAVADTDLTDHVVKWASKFLKNSHAAERTEDWHRCLFAAADFQLGGSLNLSVPKSPVVADVRAILLAKSIVECDAQADDNGQQTLRLAVHELADELSCDRALMRFAAVEWVVQVVASNLCKKSASRVPKVNRRLSDCDTGVHDVVGAERFGTLTNAEIMRDVGLRKRLRVDFQLEPGGDDTKCCFDRIRDAKGHPLSSKIKKKRSTSA